MFCSSLSSAESRRGIIRQYIVRRGFVEKLGKLLCATPKSQTIIEPFRIGNLCIRLCMGSALGTYLYASGILFIIQSGNSLAEPTTHEKPPTSIGPSLTANNA